MTGKTKSTEISIIGISGKLCSGKDTLADGIVSNADRRYSKVSLASPLKRAVQRMAGFEETPQNKDIFRPVYQSFGSLMRDGVHPDYWVRKFAQQVKRSGYTHIIVPDVRYPNELAGLRALGNCFLVRLQIDQVEQNIRHQRLYGIGLSEAKRTHISETALDGHEEEFDLVIDAKSLPHLIQLSTITLAKEKGLNICYWNGLPVLDAEVAA